MDTELVDPRLPRATSHRGAFLAALVAIAAIGVGLWLWNDRAEAPRVPAPSASTSEEPAVVPPIPAPGARHPIGNVRTEAAPEAALPPLDQSDASVLAALGKALGGTVALDRVLVNEDVVRRFVVTVDNLPRSAVAARYLPWRAVPGRLATDAQGQFVSLAPSNASRYATHLALVDAADPKTLVALYVRNYPLFQQAYRDLGYPNGHFNDRLVEAIDSLLATPQLEGPLELTQPRVLWQYADPSLEALPAGQKLLLRTGPENVAHVKAKLRAIRAMLTGEPALRN